MKYLKFILILALFSCQRDELKPSAETICSNCITGIWELTYRVYVINNDTLELFENDTLNAFWNGERWMKYKSNLELEVNDDNFLFNEFKEGYINGENDTIKYTDTWKWINSSISKTHLYLPIEIKEGWITTVFKLVKLTEDELILENDRTMNGIRDYQLLKFTKTKSSLDKEINIEYKIYQTPSIIIGEWELDEFSYRRNDSVFSSFSNDTLTIQSYGMVGRPPVYVKEIIRGNYSLIINIKNFGDFSADDLFGLTSNYRAGYWSWADEENPYKCLFFPETIERWVRPSLNNVNGYKIERIDKNSMELMLNYFSLANDSLPFPVCYKFKRKNN